LQHRPLPPEPGREIIEIEPDADEKICEGCHSPKERIGEEVTGKFDSVPACFKVKCYVRDKYACKQCEGNISFAPLPPMAIDKGIGGRRLTG